LRAAESDLRRRLFAKTVHFSRICGAFGYHNRRKSTPFAPGLDASVAAFSQVQAAK